MKEVYNLYYLDEQVNNTPLSEADVKEVMSHKTINVATKSGKILNTFPTSKLKVKKRLII